MTAATYKYGLLAPTTHGEEVLRQIRAAHGLYNKLVEIEKWRVAETRKFWAITGGYTLLVDSLPDPEALLAPVRAARPDCRGREDRDEYKAALTAALVPYKEALKVIFALEKQTRLDACATPEDRARKERASELRKKAREEGRKLSKMELAALLDADPRCVGPADLLRIQGTEEAASRGKKMSGKALNSAKRALGIVLPTQHIEDEAKVRGYTAYKAAGVTYGTRSLIDGTNGRFTKAKADSAPFTPDFAAWEGKGALGTYFTSGAAGTFSDLATNLHARIVAAPDSPKTTPGSRASGKRAVLSLRIGSNPDRSPVWADFPLWLGGRQIPKDATINSVAVKVERVGLRDKWYCLITATHEKVQRRPTPKQRSGTVALDITWRQVPGTDDIRTGYWVDDAGNSGSVNVPAASIYLLKEAKGLQQVCSFDLCSDLGGDAVDGMVMRLYRWVKAPGCELPEWLVIEASHVHQWRSGERLAKLAEKWCAQRFDGDLSIFEDLWSWRTGEVDRKSSRPGKRDGGWRHYYQWIANNRERAQRIRMEAYRLLACQLSDRYESVLVRDLDLAQIKEHSPAPVRAQYHFTSPGELYDEVTRIAGGYGCLVFPMDDARLLVRCHSCGEDDTDWDRAKELRHTCRHCGAVWDQHHNVAKNMLDLHCERFSATKDAVPARSRKTKGK